MFFAFIYPRNIFFFVSWMIILCLFVHEIHFFRFLDDYDGKACTLLKLIMQFCWKIVESFLFCIVNKANSISSHLSVLAIFNNCHINVISIWLHIIFGEKKHNSVHYHLSKTNNNSHNPKIQQRIHHRNHILFHQ